MKRLHEETLPGDKLWNYIDLVWILLSEDIYMSGPLARTCHTILKTMCSTEMIEKLVNHCHKEWKVIPKWLCFTLPHQLFLEESDPFRFYLELDVIPTLADYIQNKPLDCECVLVGSLVTGCSQGSKMGGL